MASPEDLGFPAGTINWILLSVSALNMLDFAWRRMNCSASLAGCKAQVWEGDCFRSG